MYIYIYIYIYNPADTVFTRPATFRDLPLGGQLLRQVNVYHIYIYIYVLSIYLSISLSLYIYISLSLYLYLSLSLYIYIYTYVYIHICVYIYICIYIHICVYIYMYIYSPPGPPTWPPASSSGTPCSEGWPGRSRGSLSDANKLPRTPVVTNLRIVVFSCYSYFLRIGQVGILLLVVISQ